VGRKEDLREERGRRVRGGGRGEAEGSLRAGTREGRGERMIVCGVMVSVEGFPRMEGAFTPPPSPFPV
jgi:hypothetical protein